MLSLLLLALVPSPEPLHSLHDLIEFGQLRHVQLLQPRGEVVRFATQIELGTMEKEHWPEGEDTCIAIFEGESLEPVAELAVGTSIIPEFTWTERPAWSLVELGKLTVLAVLVPPDSPEDDESAARNLRLCSFPQGEELISIPGVQEIEDGLVQDGRGDLLVRRRGQVLWLRSSETAEVINVATIDLGLDAVACAAFVRGEVGEELGAWAVGWKGGELLAVPLGLSGGGAQRGFRVVFNGGPSNDVLRVGEPLRAAAWMRGSSTHLAVSWPGFDSGLGKLQVIDVSSEPRLLWEGRPYPRADEKRRLDCRDYGQAIAFVPDTNEDGVPEILVTGPWKFGDTNIDLLSGHTGALVKSWTPGGWRSTGHSLSLSADARQVLVGGAEFRAYPEDLTEEGQAHLLDVVRMEKLQTWNLSPRER